MKPILTREQVEQSKRLDCAASMRREAERNQSKMTLAEFLDTQGTYSQRKRWGHKKMADTIKRWESITGKQAPKPEWAR